MRELYKQEDSVEEVKNFSESFPALKFEEEIDDVVPEEDEIFYLWNTSECTFKIYKILISYLDENYRVNAVVLIELIKANAAPMEKTLHDIPYLHSGYVSTILPTKSTEGNDNG